MGDHSSRDRTLLYLVMGWSVIQLKSGLTSTPGGGWTVRGLDRVENFSTASRSGCPYVETRRRDVLHGQWACRLCRSLHCGFAMVGVTLLSRPSFFLRQRFRELHQGALPADAATICEAVTRPTMRFVPVDRRAASHIDRASHARPSDQPANSADQCPTGASGRTRPCRQPVS